MSSHETTSRARNDASHLGRLNDLDDYKVAEGYPDIRGWDVRTAGGQSVGTVGDLIVDTAAMRVRYLDVEVGRSAGQVAGGAVTPGDQERHTLVPIGNVQLDQQSDHVTVEGYTLDQIAELPRYGGQTITRDYEHALRDRHRSREAIAGAAAATGAAVEGAGHAATQAVAGTARARQETQHQETQQYEHPDYDDQRLYATRRDQGQRMTLAEEQLHLGKRQVSGGAAEIRKAVDTRHVQEHVDVMHEEVTVERRPLTDGAQMQPVRDDEISIPVMEERLVIEKRLVPVEQVIVRKRQVTQQQTVDADLRRERLVIDDAATRSAPPVRDAGTSAATGPTRLTNDR